MITRNRNPAFIGASEEWLRYQIFGTDSKLDELRNIILTTQSRIDFFEQTRRDLIDELANPKQYCEDCRGKLVEGFGHICPRPTP